MKKFVLLLCLAAAFVLPASATAREIQPANDLGGGGIGCYWAYYDTVCVQLTYTSLCHDRYRHTCTGEIRG